MQDRGCGAQDGRRQHQAKAAASEEGEDGGLSTSPDVKVAAGAEETGCTVTLPPFLGRPIGGQAL